MLVLSRRVGESITIGENVVVTVVGINGNQIRLGIAAPREVRVLREEIYKAMHSENKAAATGAQTDRRLENVTKQFRQRNPERADD